MSDKAMTYCRICNGPVTFAPAFGWQHMALKEFDHDVEVGR